jgi:hypothetical protein
MRKSSRFSAVVLIAAALGAGVAHAQMTNPRTTPAGNTVRAIQPGLLEVTGPHVNDVYGAGIQKITARPGHSIEVQSPWGNINFGWPKDVKPVAFTITTARKGGVTISAPGLTEANKADYKAAIDPVVAMAIDKAQAQKQRKLAQ